ncbi:MAG: hypothetical protein HYX51_10520 [Chloroflexi bacterium]|nr:hypothetical protein [Chloroflexota bacterium]
MRTIMHFPGDSVAVDLSPNFVNDINGRVERGKMSLQSLQDLVHQIKYFENNEDWIIDRFRGQAIAVVDNEVLASNNASTVIKHARSEYPGKMYYVVDVPESGTIPRHLDPHETPIEFNYEVGDGRVSVRRVG